MSEYEYQVEKKKSVSLKIIVVDDSELSRTTISKILTDQGYNVVATASSAKDALKQLGSVDCNLFIVDVVMPEVGGIDLVKTLIDQGFNFKYIMISSLDLDNVVIESISSGATDFLKKPFSSKELLDSVSRVEKIMIEEL